MSWPERHLHWTLLLACVATTMANLVADTFSSYDMHLWLSVVISYGLPLIPCGWVLRQKGQTLWWLPIIWIPFIWWIYASSIPFIGWVIPFVLRNRRQPEYALATGTDDRADPEYSGSQPSGLPCAVRLAGVLTGLIAAGGGMVMLWLVSEAHDPGHGIMLLGAAVAAGGVLGLISGGVLCVRVHATRENRTKSSSPGSGLAPRRGSG